jgi:hypothetical protein
MDSTFQLVYKGWESTPMWVKLPNLPMEYCTEPTIWEIGNILGKTILVDEKFVTLSFHSIVSVLVDIILSKGLFESLDLVHDGKKHT